MTGPEHGRRTGQHEQREQQAAFVGCDEATRDLIERYMPQPARITLEWPARDIDLAEIVPAVFVHDDRIQIEMERRCEECGAWTTTPRIWRGKAGAALVLCPDCMGAYL